MKKIVKASLIALSAVLATSAVAAVSAPHAVSAKGKKEGNKESKKEVKKIDSAQFKKQGAGMDKAYAEFMKQQASLVKKLKLSQTQLLKQLQDALAQAPAQEPADPNAPDANPPAAGGTTADPAAPPASPVPTEPAAPAPTTPPADSQTPVPTAPANKADPALVDLLKKLAAKDAGFSGFLSGKQLDKAASQAKSWLALEDQLEKAAATDVKLKTSYDETVKSKNYAEALKIRAQQAELAKQVNKALGSMLKAEHLISVTVKEALSSDDEDGDDHEEEND